MSENTELEIKEVLDIGKDILKKKWNLSQFQALQIASQIQTNIHLEKIAKYLEPPVVPEVITEGGIV